MRGFFWKAQLLNGQVASVKALAKQEGVHPSYVMRLLRLTFLAPDLIQAILEGTQPVNLTLEQFRKPIPLQWAEQRRGLKFSPR